MVQLVERMLLDIFEGGLSDESSIDGRRSAESFDRIAVKGFEEVSRLERTWWRRLDEVGTAEVESA